MNNVRCLKKDINSLTYELVNECLTYKIFHPEASAEKIDTIVKDIITHRNELIARVNHPEGKTPKEIKAAFQGINKDIKEKFVGLLDKLAE